MTTTTNGNAARAVVTSPITIVDSTLGIYEITGTEASRKVRAVSDLRGIAGEDPDLGESAVQVLDSGGAAYGILWAALPLTEERREDFVLKVFDKLGIDQQLLHHVLTIIGEVEERSSTQDEDPLRIKGPTGDRVLLVKNGPRNSSEPTLLGDSGVLEDKTDEGKFCLAIVSPNTETKIFPDLLSFLLATTSDPVRLHKAVRTISSAGSKDLEDALALPSLMSGLKSIRQLSFRNRKSNSRCRVGSDGMIEVKSLWTQVLIAAALIAVVAIVVVLVFVVDDDAALVAGLILGSSIIFSLLASVGQRNMWPALLLSSYIPVGDGVGRLADSAEGVLKICFEDGVVPYSENYCWSGDSGTTGVLPCSGLPASCIDRRYGSGSVVVAYSGEPMGCHKHADGYSLKRKSEYIVHVPIDAVRAIFGHSLFRRPDSTDWQELKIVLITMISSVVLVGGLLRCLVVGWPYSTDVQELNMFLITMISSIILVWGCVRYSVFGRTEVLELDTSVKESSGNKSRAKPAVLDSITRNRIKYSLLEACALGDADQVRLGGFDSTILITKEKTRSPRFFDVPTALMKDGANDRVLFLISSEVAPTVTSILHLCEWQSAILMYNQNTGVTTPLTTSAVRADPFPPGMPSRIWALSSAWAAFVFSLSDLQVCQTMILPLVVMSRIFAHRQSAREVVIFAEAWNQKIYAAASVGLHVHPLADAALQAVLSYTIIVARLFSSETASVFGLMTGASPIAAMCLFDLVGMANVARAGKTIPFYMAVLVVPLSVSWAFVWITFQNDALIPYSLGGMVAIVLVVCAQIGASCLDDPSPAVAFSLLLGAVSMAGILASWYDFDHWPLRGTAKRDVDGFDGMLLGIRDVWFDSGTSIECWFFRTFVSGLVCGCIALNMFGIVGELEKEKRELHLGKVRGGALIREDWLRKQHCCHMEESRLMTPILPVVGDNRAGLHVHRDNGTNTKIKDAISGLKGTALYG